MTFRRMFSLLSGAHCCARPFPRGGGEKDRDPCGKLGLFIGFITVMTPRSATSDYGNHLLEATISMTRWSGTTKTASWFPASQKSGKFSEDGMTYTFTLRADVKFSDGTPLTRRR